MLLCNIKNKYIRKFKIILYFIPSLIAVTIINIIKYDEFMNAVKHAWEGK